MDKAAEKSQSSSSVTTCSHKRGHKWEARYGAISMDDFLRVSSASWETTDLLQRLQPYLGDICVRCGAEHKGLVPKQPAEAPEDQTMYMMAPCINGECHKFEPRYAEIRNPHMESGGRRSGYICDVCTKCGATRRTHPTCQ